jgi:hypothetical protein
MSQARGIKVIKYGGLNGISIEHGACCMMPRYDGAALVSLIGAGLFA